MLEPLLCRIMVRCPQCGEEYANTRGLGTHRHYAHGYQGEVRVKPGESRKPEVVTLLRRLDRMQRRLEKCLNENRDLKTKLQAVRKALEPNGRGKA